MVRASVIPKPLQYREFETARALVVDEDPIAREIVTRYLRAWKIASCGHASHPDAIQELLRAEQGKISSASEDLAHAIHTEFGNSAPKLVLMTPFDWHISPARLKASRFSALVSKPLKQSHLFDSLMRKLTDSVAQEIVPMKNSKLNVLARMLLSSSLTARRAA